MTFTVSVKHGAQSVDVELTAEGASVFSLEQEVERLTGVFIRKQKIIFKGKVITGLDKKKLTELGVRPGAKLLLLAADGIQTQGQVAASLVKKQKQEEVASRLKGLMADAKAGRPLISSASTPGGSSSSSSYSASRIDREERKRNWGKAGVLGLRDLGLSLLEEQVFESIEGTVKVADLSLNKLLALPGSIGGLTSLHTLKLSKNALTTEGVPWAALYRLPLKMLALDVNQLRELPAEGLSQLSGTLVVLLLGGNKLQHLPEEVGRLSCLEALAVDDNQLGELPASLAACSQLMELSANNNAISTIPVDYAGLLKLQSLLLDNNRVPSVPPALLTGCINLSILSLLQNPITVEQLRSTEGFAAYDARRCARVDKQIDSCVLAQASRAFHEGADTVRWAHWGTGNNASKPPGK